MDNLYVANICQKPEAWANTKILQESCSKSNVHTQNHQHDLLLPSAVIVIPMLMVTIWKLGQHYQRQQQRNRAFVRLQKIVMLERMLNKQVKS